MLVVDDDAVSRTFLARVVERCGLVAVQATNLAEARALSLGRATLLCALVDKNLPDGTGLALMAELHSAQPFMPLVMVTAFLDAQSAVAAMRAGAVDVLNKPPDVQAIRALIDSFVARAQAQEQAAHALARVASELARAHTELVALGAVGERALAAVKSAGDAARAAKPLQSS